MFGIHALNLQEIIDKAGRAGAFPVFNNTALYKAVGKKSLAKSKNLLNADRG
jgi:hypothetical protein